MNCVRCQREIPDGSMFCCYCGKKQETQRRKRAKRPNMSGTARKRGRYYEAIWTVASPELTADGRIKQFRKSKSGFKTRKEAEDYCILMMNKVAEARKAPELKVYWNIYKEKRLPELSKDKISAYKKAWERLTPLHGRRVDTIYTKDMQDLIDSLNLTYYPAKYMKAVLQRLFEYAAGERFASKDLPDLIELPPLNATAREPFTEEEQKKIWESYAEGNTDAAMPLTMIYTGMMPGELQLLVKENIDFDNGTISGMGLKTEVRRSTPVVLSEEAYCILKERVSGLSDTDSVFCRDEKKFYKLYYHALEVAGVRKLTPYSCRHTTATILAVKKNIPAQAIKKMMRWSTAKMLNNYAHPDVEDARSAANAIRYNKTTEE